MDVRRPGILTPPHRPAEPESWCDVNLMPWFPFPCSYDGVNATGGASNFCTNSSMGAFSNGFYNGSASLASCGSLPKCNGARSVSRAVLRLEFKVAQGVQYDRQYALTINRAMVGSPCYDLIPPSYCFSNNL